MNDEKMEGVGEEKKTQVNFSSFGDFIISTVVFFYLVIKKLHTPLSHSLSKKNHKPMETRENDETIQLKRKVEDDVEADKPRKRANALPDSSAKNWVSVSFRGHRVRYRKCTFLKFPECTLSKMILGPELAGNVECGSYSPVIAQDFDEKGYVLVDLDFDVISPIITFMQYEHATGEQFIRFPSHVPRHTALSVCSFLGMEPYMYSFCKREFNKFTERESAFDFLESVISLLRAFFAMVLQLENVGHQSNPKALHLWQFCKYSL